MLQIKQTHNHGSISEKKQNPRIASKNLVAVSILSFLHKFKLIFKFDFRPKTRKRELDINQLTKKSFVGRRYEQSAVSKRIYFKKCNFAFIQSIELLK